VTTLLPYVHELSIIGVADRGVPNRERIIIRPTEAVELGRFGLFLGINRPDGTVLPLRDQFFWFGDQIVAPPAWLFVFTGPGVYQESRVPETGHLAHSYHWGRHTTVLGDESIVPCLFRFDGIGIGRPGP